VRCCEGGSGYDGQVNLLQKKELVNVPRRTQERNRGLYRRLKDLDRTDLLNNSPAFPSIP
jgi:hypothetical protein